MVTGEILANSSARQTGSGHKKSPSARFVVVSLGDSVWDVVAAMRCTKSAFALVALRDGGFVTSNVQGIITRKEMMHRLASDIELFGV